jgi:DNA-directed RNA polymerase specialized sigma24 family protein
MEALSGFFVAALNGSALNTPVEVERTGGRLLDEQGRRDLEVAYRTFGPDVWRSVFAYAGGIRDIADEAVSEAFAQAGRRLPHIRSLRPWIYRAAFRIAAGELHRRGRRRRRSGRAMNRRQLTRAPWRSSTCSVT